MAAQQVLLREVYGIARDLPQNYVVRPDIDGRLLDALTRDQHIVIYGSSKQGKTCLRKWNLNDDDYVVVTCSNKWDLSQLHSAILKSAGYSVEQSTKRTFSGENKITAKVSGRLRLGVAEVGGELGSDSGQAETTEVQEVALELDPADVNDIIAALVDIDFKQFIVLEDFHYLPEQTQKDFAVALKAFHEGSPFCFIVVGVWLDENRLIQYNGDLTGRVITVNADAWSEQELSDVVHLGERLMNVRFDGKFLSDLIAGCFDTVYLVQECCYRVCESAGIFSAPTETTRVGEGVSAGELIRFVVDTQSARYNAFIVNFGAGFKKTELEMFRWLLVPILLASPGELERGLTYNQLTQHLHRFHPQRGSLNLGNVTQALLSVASLQVQKDIKPIILDYDQTNRRLNVVDRGFLIWREHQDRESLINNLGLTLATPG